MAKRLLTDYRGVLQADGYGGYNWTEESQGIKRIGCNMHSRRKFESAFKIGSKNGRGLAREGLQFYQKVYAIEEEARGRPPNERKTIRENKARPLFEEFKEKCEREIKKIPPRSKIAAAMSYFLNEYDRLTGYLMDGILEADNGFAERAIKSFAIGRKNWMFADTPAGADASALFYSLIATIKANGGDPQSVIKKLFDQVPLAKTLEDFESLVDLILSRK